MVKIGVVGVGGIGGYYGGRLACYFNGRDDGRVTFIARGAHLNAIRQNGLKCMTVAATFTAVPHAALDDPAGCGLFDVLLFGVKTYDLESSAALLKPNVGADTVVITLLNGVDNAARLKKIFPHARVMNGCVYISAFIQSPGQVRQIGGSCQLFWGSPAAPDADCRALDAVFQSAGIKAAYREDIQDLVWEKYIFISPLASATTYLNKNFGQIKTDPEAFRLTQELLAEVEQVGRAQGMNFPADIANITLSKIDLFPPDTETSMQKDFACGARTEVETFSGYIVRCGRQHGLAVPVNARVYAALLKRLAPQTS